MPVVYVALQKNRTLFENIVGADIEKETQERIEREFTKVQQAK